MQMQNGATITKVQLDHYNTAITHARHGLQQLQKHKRTRYSQGGVHANVQIAVHLALHIALQRSIKNNGKLQTTARA